MDGYIPSGLTPKKSFGQNFLVDEKVVADLVAAANLTREDVVVEIGAGTGVVTKELAKRAGKVLAFELDCDLIPVLEKNLSGFDNVKILNEDFLRSSPHHLFTSSSQLYKIVGSIPYQITSPLIHKLLTLEPKPTLVVLLIQKEVAEKITAQPPKATYLSNIVKLFGSIEIVHLVPKTAFWPVPAVDGAIVKIVLGVPPLKSPQAAILRIYENLKIENFLMFLHQGFKHPRKMLRTKFDPPDLEKCGIASTRRAQTLEFDEWLKLYEWYNQ